VGERHGQLGLSLPEFPSPKLRLFNFNNCNSSIIWFQFFEQPNTVVDLGYLVKKFIPAQLDPGIGSSSKLS